MDLLYSLCQPSDFKSQIHNIRRIEKQLEKFHVREMSYAELRADSSISEVMHKELVLRLRDARKGLLQTRELLQKKEKIINEARSQKVTAQTLVSSLPEVLPELSIKEKESLVVALIARVDVSGDNHVVITLRLSPDVLDDLPNLPSESSPPLELGP